MNLDDGICGGIVRCCGEHNKKTSFVMSKFRRPGLGNKAPRIGNSDGVPTEKAGSVCAQTSTPPRAPDHTIVFVENFLDELQRRVPLK
jgi:hypothetical protein